MALFVDLVALSNGLHGSVQMDSVALFSWIGWLRHHGILKEHIENEYGYDLSMSLDEIRKDYKFDETCQGSVPQAIIAFLESTDFEDAIRNAISIGGDSDTIAAITGSIAEADYGISDDMKEMALSYLDEPLKDVLRRWKKYMRGGKS